MTYLVLEVTDSISVKGVASRFGCGVN